MVVVVVVADLSTGFAQVRGAYKLASERQPKVLEVVLQWAPTRCKNRIGIKTYVVLFAPTR
jgi:hypothetical protein